MEDTRKSIRNRACNDSLDMQITRNKVWILQVNYQACIGKSIGKCCIKISSFQSTDTFSMKDKVRTQLIKVRDFLGTG